MRRKDDYDKFFRDNHCWNCPIMDLDLCNNCHYYIDIEDIKLDFLDDIDIDDDIYDYDYDYCEECRLYGDDMYIDTDGEMVSRCSECYENPDNYDDGYYIGDD